MLRNAIQTMTGAAVLAGAGFVAMLALASGQSPSSQSDSQTAVYIPANRVDVTKTVYLPDIWSPQLALSLYGAECVVFKGGSGYLSRVGVIANNLDWAISGTKVQIKFYDLNNIVVATQTANVAPSIILSQRIGLFAFAYGSASNYTCSNVDQTGRIEAQAVDWEKVDKPRVRPLTVLSTTGCFMCYPETLYVTVRNDQGITLTNLQGYLQGSGGVFLSQSAYSPPITVLAPMSSTLLFFQSFSTASLYGGGPIMAQGEIYP